MDQRCMVQSDFLHAVFCLKCSHQEVSPALRGHHIVGKHHWRPLVVGDDCVSTIGLCLDIDPFTQRMGAASRYLCHLWQFAFCHKFKNHSPDSNHCHGVCESLDGGHICRVFFGGKNDKSTPSSHHFGCFRWGDDPGVQNIFHLMGIHNVGLGAPHGQRFVYRHTHHQ